MTTILPQIEQQLLRAASRQARRPHARLLARVSSLRGDAPTPPGPRRRPLKPALALLPLAVVGALLGFMLLGGTGDKQFDVAAAAYRALALGSGVRYIAVDEEENFSGHHSVRHFQYWRTAHPWRERSVYEGPNDGHSPNERLEQAIKQGGTWLDWWSGRPKAILRTDNRRATQEMDEKWIRTYYKSKTLRLVSKISFEGRDAYRLEVVHPPNFGAEPVEFVVAANTFAPIEMVNYARNRKGKVVPQIVTHYRVYEELPATPQNLALLNIARHPGAKIYPAPAPPHPCPHADSPATLRACLRLRK
jgi:hypothetical protein